MKQGTGRAVMMVVGLSMVAGFFLPWLDAGDMITVSGYNAFWRMQQEWSLFRVIMLLVPVAGAAIAVTSAAASRYAKHVSMGTGLVFVGYGLFKAVQAFFAVTGWGLWMVLGAAILAVFVPLVTRRDRA